LPTNLTNLSIELFFYTYYVYDLVPPKWIVEPEDTAVLDNQLTIINCQAEGYPEPRITWTRVSGL